MIIIDSKNQIAPGKTEQIIQKLVDKKFVDNTPAAIEEQLKEIEKWTEDAKDAMIRVLNKT